MQGGMSSDEVWRFDSYKNISTYKFQSSYLSPPDFSDTYFILQLTSIVLVRLLTSEKLLQGMG